MAASPGPAADDARSLARILWARRVPVLIAHEELGGWADGDADRAGADGDSKGDGDGDGGRETTPRWYAASVPRFGYLAQLLPRLAAFFGRPCSSFAFEGVPLRNLPAGLLADLYRGGGGGTGGTDAPWRLVVGAGPAWHLGDTFLNGAKEADYMRYGSAKQILGLSKADTEALWHAVQDNDYTAFARVNQRLLNAPVPLRHIPLRLYVPAPTPSVADAGANTASNTTTPAPGTYKMLQALVPPRVGQRGPPQTLGAALRSLLPLLFPSSRDPVLATAVLHGAAVPFHAPLEALMREAAYPDGWLCVVVVLL